MVHNTASAAAIMASELWRVNGWCVTGTPVSNSLHGLLLHGRASYDPDLHGLLVFLDHDPFADHTSFNRLLV
jgi:hypothetical protein